MGVRIPDEHLKVAKPVNIWGDFSGKAVLDVLFSIFRWLERMFLLPSNINIVSFRSHLHLITIIIILTKAQGVFN